MWIHEYSIKMLIYAKKLRYTKKAKYEEKKICWL